jgi:Ni/Fe-hydrogenase subunit HybB-like protein
MSKRLTYLKTGLWALVGVLASVTVIRFAYGLGAVTNLSDGTPWGLWIGFDVMSGVALAAGGFVLAAVVYIFGLERYRPFVRAAILTAFLGYAAVAVGLFYDLGLPWRIWHPLVNWQYHSVLFEVAMCVMLYLTVLALEFAPVILEHPLFDRPFFRSLLRGLKRISILLVIAGIVLSTLHQSSLGSLFLITPDRLHPLWYSSSIYVQFFISAVALGLMTVVLESLFSGYFLGHKVHGRELAGLGLGAAAVLGLYLALRLGDLAARGILGMAFDGSWQGALFLFEIGVSAVIPMVLMLIPSVRSRIGGVGVAATMVVGGMILHRLNVSIIAFARPEAFSYFPSWEEFAVTLGIVAGAMLIFLFFVEHLKVFDDVQGHVDPEPRRFEPSTVRDLMAPSRALPRRYSLALVGGAAVALLFLPLDGAEYQPAPAGAPRWVEGAVVSRADAPAVLGFAAAAAAGAGGAVAEPRRVTPGGAEEKLLLLIDGNRAAELALFDHEAHEARLGEGACGSCHHLNLPLDEGSSCSECHRDMYAPTPLFDHGVHEAALGGDAGCAECHVEGEPKTMASATACSECHEASGSEVIEAPADRWAPAAGYMDAMHGLCVTCHEQAVAESPNEHPEGLAECSTCHDPDLREQRDRLAPRKQGEPGAVAVGRAPRK